jgi:hypothetical protein
MIRIYAIIIVIALLLTSLGGCYWLYGQWRAAEKEKKSLVELNGKSFKEVSYYQNRLGNEVAKNKTLQLETKTVKELVKEGQLPILKEFEGLKKNYRNLESLMQASIRMNSQLSLQVQNDSSFKYQDEFRHLIGRITHDSTGYIANITDTTVVPIDIVVYWKRKWFLGKKVYVAEAVSKNKAAKIIGLETIQIRKR